MQMASRAPVTHVSLKPGQTVFGVSCPVVGPYFFQIPAKCAVDYRGHGVCFGRVVSFDTVHNDFIFEFSGDDDAEQDREWLPHKDFKIVEQVQVTLATEIFWPLRCLVRSSAMLWVHCAVLWLG